jgi:hypothetical protein
VSVDERLRSALRDQAQSFAPSVEAALEDVRNRGRRPRWRSATVAVASTAAAAAALAGAVAWLGHTGTQDGPPADEPSPSTVAVDPTSATLQGRITANVAAPQDLAGTWTLPLNGNGSIDVEPPTDYPGVVSGALFSTYGSTFRTTLFQTDVCAGDGSGTYRWLETGDRIEFHVTSDPCATRVRFFEESAWTLDDPPFATAPDGSAIPDGTWTKTTTTADATRLGIPKDEHERLLGQDGELHVELRIEGNNYELSMDDQGGADLTLGDPGRCAPWDCAPPHGTAEYDAAGNWVTTSASQGCPACRTTYQWSMDGPLLVLTVLDARTHAGRLDVLHLRLVTEGTYTRQ